MEHTISFYPTELSIAFLISSSTLKTTAKTEQLMGKMFETMEKKVFLTVKLNTKNITFLRSQIGKLRFCWFSFFWLVKRDTCMLDRQTVHYIVFISVLLALILFYFNFFLSFESIELCQAFGKGVGFFQFKLRLSEASLLLDYLHNRYPTRKTVCSCRFRYFNG